MTKYYLVLAILNAVVVIPEPMTELQCGLTGEMARKKPGFRTYVCIEIDGYALTVKPRSPSQ